MVMPKYTDRSTGQESIHHLMARAETETYLGLGAPLGRTQSLRAQGKEFWDPPPDLIQAPAAVTAGQAAPGPPEMLYGVG